MLLKKTSFIQVVRLLRCKIDVTVFIFLVFYLQLDGAVKICETRLEQ